MQEPPETSINWPPFPPLQRSDYFWSAPLHLSAWAGFQSRLDDYGAQSSTADSDGATELNIAIPDDEQLPPSPEQATAYLHLLENQAAIRDAVLQAIFTRYPEWQTMYGYAPDELEQFMPNIASPEQLRPLIGLSVVHISRITKDGLAYIGFEFGCTWDVEHGLGVMTHTNRAIEAGGAEIAFLDWAAETDAGAGS